MKEIKKIKKFQSGDGSHWGLSDWYSDKEMALRKAIKSKGDFTTGWYGSKKEIASANISRIKGYYTIEASVSDDFDTSGYGQQEFKSGGSVDQIIKKIETAVNKAWDLAEDNRKDNQTYLGFSVIHDDSWVETYLVNMGGCDMPSGDNYHQWGFQDNIVPKQVQKKLAEWAEEWDGTQDSFTYKGWTIKPWDNE